MLVLPAFQLLRAGKLLGTTARSVVLAFEAAPTRKHHAIEHEFVVPPNIASNTAVAEALVAINSTRYPTMTQARKACRQGNVLINGAEARCIHVVSPGDVISLQLRVNSGRPPLGLPPFPIDVVWEDDHLGVVIKPAGVPSHAPPGGSPGGASMRTAIAHALRPPSAGTPSAMHRPHLCHRLDKPTYGLLLCAKTKRSFDAIHRAFVSRSILKRYVAVVGGVVHAEAGQIDAEVDGKPALSSWRVLSRARSLVLGGGHLTLLELRPHSGRTHQLRRHCSEVLGTPIVGDKQYGGDDAGCGLLLAAVGLDFDHPSVHEIDGSPRRLHLSIEPPPAFRNLMCHEQSRWDTQPS